MTRILSALQADWDAWHSTREAQLQTPHGWLSLTALHWLTPDATGIEGLPGRWSATPQGVTVAATAADGLVVVDGDGDEDGEGEPIDGSVTLHPVDGMPGSLVAAGERVVEIARRTDSHVLRVRDPQAPTRTAFTGVPAFPVDERWVLDARFEPYPEPRPITVDAVVAGLNHFPTALGVVRFAVDGEDHRLVALAGRTGGLSLHFRDATSGETTYPGGRLVQVEDPAPDGSVTVDLNRLVNLPCAFTEFATCPLPPAGNVLEVAVEAGERDPA